MRLRVTSPSAHEKIVSLINRGYALRNLIIDELSELKTTKTYDPLVHGADFDKKANEWATDTVNTLNDIFPTELESNIFLNPDVPVQYVSQDTTPTDKLVHNLISFIRGLEQIRIASISQYTDLPLKERFYIEDIDSFQKVRDVNPQMVLKYLNNGFLDLSEEKTQLALEQILNVSFHKKDWGGEFNDLYTANVIVNGIRRSTAFLLKGNGIGNKEMTIADCGKNGDQIVRLFSVSADLFVIQYVGNISEMVIKDIEGKAQGKKVNFLIIDGQDTARLLLAYGKID
jgi:hypothetical protein